MVEEDTPWFTEEEIRAGAKFQASSTTQTVTAATVSKVCTVCHKQKELRQFHPNMDDCISCHMRRVNHERYGRPFVQLPPKVKPKKLTAIADLRASVNGCEELPKKVRRALLAILDLARTETV